jgi:hypothetical protein
MVNMQKASSKNRWVIFAFFAAGILFAMLREWNAPVACLRPVFQATTGSTSR